MRIRSSVNRFLADAFEKVCRSGERSQMVHDMERNPVGVIRKRGAAILQHDDSKISIGRMSRGCLDDKFSGHAHQHHGIKIAAPQHALQSSSKKRVHARFSDYRLVVHRFNLVDDFQKFGYIDPGGG